MTHAVLLGFTLTAAGCSTVDSLLGTKRPVEGVAGFVTGFLGAAVSDEPQATQVGRQVLAAGGNAADAAVAIGYALAVTYPSRAGLGGGGACLAQRADRTAAGVPDAFLFLPVAPGSSAGADRPAAVPMMARGLFLLHARHGKARFETLVQPAELMAREGVSASRAFTRDLTVVGGALAADAAARQIFFPGGRALAEGDLMVQSDLGSTIAQMNRAGVGDLYVGSLAQRLIAAAGQAGATFASADLRAAVPRLVPSLTVPGAGDAYASFLPLPADGGLAAAAAFQALRTNPNELEVARARGLAAAAHYRSVGGEAEAILTGLASGAALASLPASTSFATLDKDGNAVVCAVSMGNLFGTGRVAPGTGILLAASPAWLPPPLYAAGMLTIRQTSAVRSVAGASGQEGAPLAVAVTLARALADKGRVAEIAPLAAPEPGRVNIIGCARPADQAPESCGWATDPRGFGLATGSN